MSADAKKVVKLTRQYTVRLIFGILLCMPGIVALIAVLPLGIIILTPAVLLIVFGARAGAKAKALKQTLIRYQGIQYRPAKEFRESNGVVYAFVSPLPQQATCRLLYDVLADMGCTMKGVDERQGYILARTHLFGLNSSKLETFVERGEEKCRVRMSFGKTANDDYWDFFIACLSDHAPPDMDFGITPAWGNPFPAATLFLGSETEQQLQAFTTAHTYYGWLLDYTVAATRGTVREQFSRVQLVRIIYNNGRIWEGVVKKGSPLYNQIMLNAPRR